ncbi:MAG: hypothetical protein QOJ29_3664, partial [Thermoleophilaceae bacterium]|nr:hypothetical protein [Thermoleophilaceae bacterium]
SKPPDCTPASTVAYLFGHGESGTRRAAHALRRAEGRGLVARRKFDTGTNAWRLTRKGSVLAEQGELLCRDCAVQPSINDGDSFDRCPACAAALYEARAEGVERQLAYQRDCTANVEAEAERHRERAAFYRLMATGDRAAA